MNTRTLAVLIALNVALLLALVVSVLSPAPAEAQFGLARGNYVMVAGPVAGRSSQSVVYITEVNTARMVATIFNSANNEFTVVAGKEMLADLQQAGR